MNMANISNHEQLLIEINDKTAILVIPAILYVGILMIVGLIGNILVCVYYGCKTKLNTNSFFIIMLAVFDLLGCTVAMPIEIVDLRFFFMFVNAPACKIARFVNTFATIGSSMTLLTIAFDRHRRMCKPFTTQLQFKDARRAFCVAVIFSLVLSWPALIFYDSVSVNVTDPKNQSVILEGFDCTTTKHEGYKSYLLAFNILHFVLFLAASVTLGVFYSLIGRVVFKHKRNRFKYTSTRPISSASVSVGAESANSTTTLHADSPAKDREHAETTDNFPDQPGSVLCDEYKEIKGDEANEITHSNVSDADTICDESEDKTRAEIEVTTTNGKTRAEKASLAAVETAANDAFSTRFSSLDARSCDGVERLNIRTQNDSDSSVGNDYTKTVRISENLNGEVVLRPKNRDSKLRPISRTSLSLSPDIKSMRYTVMMLVITVVFVVSFLPYLILVVWRITQTEYEAEILSDGELVAFQIGIRSYLLNSAINPLLYGFFNPKFRTFFYVSFCPCCVKKPGNLQSSTSSGDH